ncbi:SMI1/KNR4 family protein [bacterium]|nr:SMI1/KNR4 family protein [bacterium]
MWKRLYQRLIAAEGYQLIRPPEAKIDAALTRAEGALGVRLPNSYGAFIHEFGPGELGGYFRIYGPHIDSFADYGEDLLECVDRWQEEGMDGQKAVSAARVERLLCFSTTIGGDACFWDTGDVRNSRNHEYSIFVLSHDRFPQKLRRLANSFKDFVNQVCLGSGLGGRDADSGPPQRFSPAWKLKTVKRAQSKRAEPRTAPDRSRRSDS